MWIHVFIATEWTGEPVESDEMKPQWFGIDELPLGRMWEETTGWMPEMCRRWCNGERVAVEHCVDYWGGTERETGEWSEWEGMRGGVIRWVKQEEVEVKAWEEFVKHWEEGIKVAGAEAAGGARQQRD